MRYAPVAALLLVLVAAFAARAQERLADAAKLFPMLDKFYATPVADRSALALHYVFVHDGKPATDVHFALVVNGKRTPMALSSTGQVERVPSAADLAAHAQVAIDAPPGVKFNVRLDMATSISPAREIGAAECQAAIDQANAAIRRAAGVMALMAPRVKAATFVGAGSGVAVTADGKTLPLPLIKGAPAYDPAAVPGARTLRLARTPSLVSLE